jgi:hypothetical protein
MPGLETVIFGKRAYEIWPGRHQRQGLIPNNILETFSGHRRQVVLADFGGNAVPVGPPCKHAARMQKNRECRQGYDAHGLSS